MLAEIPTGAYAQKREERPAKSENTKCPQAPFESERDRAKHRKDARHRSCEKNQPEQLGQIQQSLPQGLFGNVGPGVINGP